MKEIKIAVIGLGYVGLPLARLLSTKYKTVGYDMNPARVESLMTGHDATLEVSDELLQGAIKNGFVCTTDIEKIRDCNFYVVAVPTPVDKNNHPDLKPLWGASETVGKVINKGDIVVYESTVYPGVTEEECLPVVEKVSGLKFNVDFFAGYSPERINPGDKLHTVEKIKKVTSGSTPEIADIVDSVYNSVLVNGTHKAPSIKVAEASKIIENSQRDVNIAFMNELAKFMPDRNIEDLPIPYKALATDVAHECAVQFCSGSLHKAVRASISIPFLFRPVRVGDCVLVDGGILNPLPLDRAIRTEGSLLVAVDVNASAESACCHNKMNIYGLLVRSSRIMMQRISSWQLVDIRPDILVSIPASRYDMMDFHRASEIIAGGELAVRQALDSDRLLANGISQ